MSRAPYRHRDRLPSLVLAALAPVAFLMMVWPALPELEAWAAPIVVEHDVRFRIEGNRIVSHQRGRKARDCRAVQREIRAVDADGDGYPLRFKSPIARVPRPEAFDLTSYADLPPDARAPLTIQAELGYRCHRLWVTPYRYPTTVVSAPESPS